jgi:serine phosphatase RsbU (regulator of sigma subunit)
MCKPPVGLGAKRNLTLLFSIVFIKFCKDNGIFKTESKELRTLKKTSLLALCILFLCLKSSVLFSQADSLYFYFNRATEADSARAAELISRLSAKDSALFMKVASRLSNKDNKEKFFHALGDHFYDVDDYESARIYYTHALKFARLTLDKRSIAYELAALGDMYRMKEQNSIALNLITQAMYIYKELKDTPNIANTLGLIGDMNRCMNQYSDAIRNLNESLDLLRVKGSERDETFAYSALGATYQSMQDYDRAMLYFNKGLDLSTEKKDTQRLIDFHYSIGDLMTDRGRVPDAISSLEKALKLTSKSDKYNIAFCKMGLAKAYLKKKDYDRAISEGMVTYRIGEELDAFGFCTEVAEALFEAHAGKGDYKNAYKYLKLVKDNADSTLSSERIKQEALAEITFRNSFQEKQDSLMRFSEEKQRDMEHESELKQQRTLAAIGIFGLLVAIIIASIMYRSYRKEKRSREIINKQKSIVDGKNKEIVDSINYARKIQQAIIPTNAEVKNIFPESFVILMPKDIVSGDFYWITEREQHIFMAVADCTGHGVPGGFMSMLGTALLNEIINDKNILEPSDILDLLKLKIVLALRQSDTTNENKDGMDLALIRINKNTRELTFAGANNSLYLLRNNELIEFKGDKQPVGYSFHNTSDQFSQQHYQLKKEDLLYMFTDGYPDQFGGPLGKKFKYKAMEEALMKEHKKEMSEQRRNLIDLHNKWKGALEQVDDICIVGIRIN